MNKQQKSKFVTNLGRERHDCKNHFLTRKTWEKNENDINFVFENGTEVLVPREELSLYLKQNPWRKGFWHKDEKTDVWRYRKMDFVLVKDSYILQFANTR